MHENAISICDSIVYEALLFQSVFIKLTFLEYDRKQTGLNTG